MKTKRAFKRRRDSTNNNINNNNNKNNNNNMTLFNEANIHYWCPNSFRYGPPIYNM